MTDTREKCPECEGRGVDPWGATCLTCGGQGKAPFREWGKEDDEDQEVLVLVTKDPLEFDDAGATDDEPVKGVTMGDIRQWHDKIEQLRHELAVATSPRSPLEEGVGSTESK